MKTLVIGDIHNKVENIDSIIDNHCPDQVVFLGDYFDSFSEQSHTEEKIARRTALWLKEMIAREYIICYGNHDMSYIFTKTCMCPGYSTIKHQTIKEIITWDEWMKLVPVIEIDGFWLSHSGMHPSIFCHPLKGFDSHDVQTLCKDAIENLKSNIPSHIFGCGADRGGMYPIGGITWLDWNYIVPIWDETGNQIKQLVGHTPDRHVRTKGKDYHCVCIDTNLRYVATITDGHLEIHKTI